jgi:ABC-type transporter Mla subunit MlaD
MARSGNGIDNAAIYQLLSEVAESVRGQGGRLDAVERKLNEIVLTVNEHSRRFDQVASMLDGHGRRLTDLSHDVESLRGTLDEYHRAVIGHGISLTELDERVERIEHQLRLDAPE